MQVLIFSQFKIMLDVLEDYLKAANYPFERIDGSTKQKDRQAAIDRFTSAKNKQPTRPVDVGSEQPGAADDAGGSSDQGKHEVPFLSAELSHMLMMYPEWRMAQHTGALSIGIVAVCKQETTANCRRLHSRPMGSNSAVVHTH